MTYAKSKNKSYKSWRTAPQPPILGEPNLEQISCPRMGALERTLQELSGCSMESSIHSRLTKITLVDFLTENKPVEIDYYLFFN
jgi:hypothetical protein